MNVGQILETHLGLAAKSLGNQVNEQLSEKFPNIDSLKDLISKFYKNDIDYINNVKKLNDKDLIDLLKDYLQEFLLKHLSLKV